MNDAAPKIFTDAYERSLDEKKRVQIPAPHRNVLDPERQGAVLYAVPGERPQTLSLYPEVYFVRKVESMHTDEIPGEDALDFEQMFFSLASRVEMDRQGRLVLPERQLAMTELGNEVYVAGARFRIDVWNKDAYESFLRDVGSRRSKLQSFLRMPDPARARERVERGGA